MYKYDFLIVGAGLFGSVCARLLNDKGFKVLVVEKDSIVGGIAKTKIKDDTIIHLNGKHIFYTDDSEVWDFVNKYSNFINFSYYNEIILSNGNYFKYPIDLNTISLITKEVYPEKIKKIIQKDIKSYGAQFKSNLEEWCISEYGFETYENIIKPYQEKFWNTECKYLSPVILDIHKNQYKYNDRYFNYKYVGVPEEGYTKLVENILGDDIDIMLNTDYLKYQESFNKKCKYIIYTGPIDRFCKYLYGPLSWNILKFEYKQEKNSSESLFGSPVINIADKDNGLLQIIEHKLLNPNTINNQSNYLTYVYPDKWDIDKDCLFSINNDQSEELLDKYIEFTKNNFDNIIFGGRQGIYRNLSMSQTIRMAIDICDNINKEEDQN